MSQLNNNHVLGMMTENMMWERLIELWYFIYMCIFNTQTKEDVLPPENQTEAFLYFFHLGKSHSICEAYLDCKRKLCVLPVCPVHQTPDNTRDGLPDKTPTLCSHSNRATSCLIVNAQTRQTRRLMVIQANLGHHDGKGAEGKHYDPSSFETTWQLTDEHP